MEMVGDLEVAIDGLESDVSTREHRTTLGEPIGTATY